MDRILRLPLIQLVVCGRSGAMLLHAMLDGHPEILHIPHTFKFYDFLAATPNIAEMSGSLIAEAFVAFPAHHSLFDSQASVLLRGRLGRSMDDRVIIETDIFCEAMAKLLPGQGHGVRRVLFAAIVAHAWCQGQQIGMAKVVFMHLHHGDWLWPGAIPETCNLSPYPIVNGIDMLVPDKLIVTVRNPSDQIRSLGRFVTTAVTDVAGQGAWFERYLRMLAQDWKRLELVKVAGIPLRVVRLEDMRIQTRQELDDLASWMGVATSIDSIDSPSIFGLPWWGDIYSTPSLSPNPPEPMESPSALNADHLFLYSAVGEIIASMKYPIIRGAGLARMAMSLPFFSIPKPSWPVAKIQWRRDLDNRNTFLEQLGRKHEQALAHEFQHPMPIGPAASA